MTHAQREAMAKHAQKLREQGRVDPNAIKESARIAQQTRASIKLRAAS